MPIDPVVLLVHELRSAQQSLAHALADENGGVHVAALEARITMLCERVLHTRPAGSLGASELLHIAADMLEACHAPYADQLRRIAARLGAGRRIGSDILWLRHMAEMLADGRCGDQADVEKLLQLAVRGATTPVIVYRAVDAPFSCAVETMR